MIKYLSIGEIAGMFNLNNQTLHYYDKEGLFMPEYRDGETGYRKYSFGQIYSLALICYLRKLGFSIERIKGYMDLKNINLTMEELEKQSQVLKKQYNHILNIDSAIQRKIKFAKKQIDTLDINDVKIKHYPRREYIPLGCEDLLYNNEIFYSYPTIAFYNYNSEDKNYDVTFGAYIAPEITVSNKYADQVRFIEESDYLCFYHKGKYEGVAQKIELVKKQYSHLNLSVNSISFNIIDQFLEKDMDEFITESQIPIL